MKILFYGTPDFAVGSLKALLDSNKNIIGVVTAPDKPAGRGYKLQKSAVKLFAEENNLPVYQPTNLKGVDFENQLNQLQPDLQIVVAFRMMPEKVWGFPKLGTFNLHASLLPNYRGAAPINWAIINGETKTGVTTFFLSHQIDTGNIIEQSEVEILPNQTAGELHDDLMNLGSRLVVKTVNQIEANSISEITQEEAIAKGSKISHAPKLDKELCKLSADENIQNIHNKIRGLSPYPGSFFIIKKDNQQKILKVFRTEIIDKKEKVESPKFEILEGELVLHLKSGILKIIELQLEGKKRMKAVDFIKGFEIENWNI
jgi:methionyl-tRNA formyltransferase